MHAIGLDSKGMALHLITQFEDIILTDADTMISALLRKISDDGFKQLEIHLTLVSILLPEFSFLHTEEFLNILEKSAEQSEEDELFSKGNVIRWSNPLMVMALSVEILSNLNEEFRSLSLRLSKVREDIITTFVGIYSEFYFPDEVEVLLH